MKTLSFVSNNRLYVGTFSRGVFRVSAAKESDAKLSTDSAK